MSHLESPAGLSTSGRYVILFCAFLGWLCAGIHMSITSLAMQPAAIDLLDRTRELDKVRLKALNQQVPKKGAPPAASPMSSSDVQQLKHWKGLVTGWFAWYQCAFLFGAASGGLLFGRFGDQWGRSKAMAASILTYSVMAGAAGFAQEPWQLLILWYLACTGVGGMWPNGVALVSEAWASMSRPMVAGVIGTAANIGIFLFATAASYISITPDGWRWVMAVAAVPGVLGIITLICVPESPHWLAARRDQVAGTAKQHSKWEVFRPPLLSATAIGIILATIPLIGAYGSANWMVPWAGDVGDAATPPNPFLKAYVQQARALTGIVGSLLGGWIGSLFGRRTTYFVISLAALMISQYTFWFVVPTDSTFLVWVAALGFFSGIYFGWLPLFLPELFPTRIRSTGAGVSFNFGRILTAATVFTTGYLTEIFGGDYAQIGRVTSLIFALGMIAILLAPNTSTKHLVD
ncbi:MAG: ygcS [Planctomycetaceae bacterium]|nr:ygcS [Planctomycetaceae bacterium]